MNMKKTLNKLMAIVRNAAKEDLNARFQISVYPEETRRDADHKIWITFSVSVNDNPYETFGFYAWNTPYEIDIRISMIRHLLSIAKKL